MPDPAGELEGHADHHVGDVVLFDECLDNRHVRVGSFTFDHVERVRSNIRLVGDRHTDGLAADVETERSHGKKKTLQGGLQGLGADRKSYLLPQVVGETSGMRGREPLVINRVETLTTSSRVGIDLVFKPAGGPGYSLERPRSRLVAWNP